MTSVRKRHRKATAPEREVQDAPVGAITKGRPGDATPGKGSDSCVAVGEDPDIIKLRTVLLMRAQGKTQPEIAAHFGKDARTIRRWEAKARCLKLGLVERLNPKEALAESLYTFAAEKADLLQLKMSAKESEDTKLYLRSVKELLRLECARMLVLERIGLFVGFAFPRDEPEDPGAQGANLLVNAARNMFSGDYELNLPANDAQEGDDGHEELF